jgi:hypothetical protein
MKTQGPAVWTTLALTLYADGSAGHELVGASSFPRHWIYDANGSLAGKSALIDFKTWYRTSTLAHSPWHGQESAILAAEAETPLERRLSLAVMRGGGQQPKPAKFKAGSTILAEGEAGMRSSCCLTAWSGSMSAVPPWRSWAPVRCWASARRLGTAAAPPRSAP